MGFPFKICLPSLDVPKPAWPGQESSAQHKAEPGWAQLVPGTLAVELGSVFVHRPFLCSIHQAFPL